MILGKQITKTEEFDLLAYKKVMTLIMIVFLIGLLGGYARAGTSGKVAGVVTDALSGEPLQGATIMVSGTRAVTEADFDGEFYIINLPVGTHTLKISLLGYETMNIEDVRVLMDLTTPLEIALVRSPIDMKKSVTVVAKRPPIQRDLTSSRTILTRDDIVSGANTTNVQNILSNVAGTVVDSDGSLHVRGGRQGSISYLYDGIDVQDPFTGEMGIRINPDALEELSLISGGIPSEYGGTLSGVVNALTREGSGRFRGSLKYYEGASHKYDVYAGDYGDLSLIDNRAVQLDVSGPLFNIGDRMSTFYSSAEYNTSGGYLPHNEGDLISGTSKLVFFPTSNSKVTVNGAYNHNDYQYYNHIDNNGYSYDFNLDGLSKIEKEAYLVGVKTDYNKSANTIISLYANRFSTTMKAAPEHLFDLHWSEWPGYLEDEDGNYIGWIQDSNYNASTDYSSLGFTDDDDYWPYYLDRQSEYTGGGFSLLSQLDKYNQIKMGGELRKYMLKWDNRQFYNVNPYGETYAAHPWKGNAYIQDKVELVDMVINLGLRLDYFNSDIEYWEDTFAKTTRIESDAKVQVSPRLGISHPVSVSSVLHFNYGWLFEPPETDLLYTNLQGDLNTGYPVIGNPDLEAEKTIYYELGWTQLINQEMKLTFTTYYRDIKDLIGTRKVVDEKGNIYTIFENNDYGSVKGFDISFTSLNRRFLNWSANYTYMIAKGNASDPYEYYYAYYTQDSEDETFIPQREYPLSYDQRHNLTIILDFRVPRGESFNFMGLNLPDSWGINLLSKFGSGMPYTRIGKDGSTGELNGERMPYTLRFDLRFDKQFYLSSANSNFVTLFAEVENLFDRRNVVSVYENTGEADDNGSLSVNESEQEQYWKTLLSHDPQNYTSPREVRIGMSYNF